MKHFNFFKLFISYSLLLMFCIGFNPLKAQDISIFKTEQQPVLDGIIDPFWQDIPFIELQNRLSGEISSDTDFSAGYRIVWDDVNLYVLVEVTDDSKINDSGTTVYKDDAVEVYIDIDNDKLQTYGDNDYQYTFRWNDTDIHGNVPIAGVGFAQTTTATGYIIELSFPWSTLGLTSIYDNVEFGFDVHVQDDDDGGEGDAKLSWFTEVDQSWNDPSLFATAQLYGTSSLPPSAPAPIFSVKRGFFNEPFDVVISSNLSNATLKYTFDGSDPRISSSAITSDLPANVRIDPDNAGSTVTPAVILRSTIITDNYSPSNVETNTYIFIDKVKTQTHPGGVWPSYEVNGQVLDFNIDQSVVNDNRYKDLIDDALLEIPSVSIVTDIDNLFGSQKGIYVNASMHGRSWERPTSFELINPDGSEGFQINAGLRIRGGYSRNSFFPKHAFRLFFREEYGASKLNFALFGNEGVKSFDKIDIRTSQNYAWSRENTNANTMTRDVFSRDLQRDMNQHYTRSRYYHLYVNGLYWGLFQSQERSEARYAASYFGGDSDDYDVIKADSQSSGIEATDGNLDAWREMWDMCQSGFSQNASYYKLQGLNTDGARNDDYKVLVDVDNLIDYMLVIFYTGNFDAPVSVWSGNKGTNNFYSIYNRNANEGFKFLAHDSEHTLLIDNHGPGSGIYENRVDLAYRTGDDKMEINSFDKFNPQWLHHKLTSNTEYKIRFIDHVYKYFFNNGAITPEKTTERFLARSQEIDSAIIGESARWGDFATNPAKNRDDDWFPTINRAVNEYFPYRTDIVLKQFKDVGLYPDTDAPEFLISNQNIKDEVIKVISGTEFTLSNPNSLGSIKYTFDGTDPRLIGGNVSQNAFDGDNQANYIIYTSTVIKARIKSGNEWSAIHEILLDVSEDLSELKITEIHYNPIDEGLISGSEFEFIELKNTGISVLNLTNCIFSDGIDYSFPSNTKLNPNEFLILASNAIEFKNRYAIEADGEYTGQLKNSGEKVVLTNISGDEILSVNYKDESPWPLSADGAGNSLVSVNINPTEDPVLSIYWRSSSAIHGSPGADDAIPDIAQVFINEALANTVYPNVDAIELYNPNNTEVNIGGWFLTDDRDEPMKWKIPNGTTIQPKGYLVFENGHYNGDVLEYTSNEFGGVNGFSLSSHGEEVYIFSANDSGELTGFARGYKFDEITPDISYGTYINSMGEKQFVQQSATTLGAENATPKVGPIVINQILYHPDAADIEYIELTNITNEAVDLFNAEETQRTWKLKGIDFDFPTNISLLPTESMYIIEETSLKENFIAKYDLPLDAKVYNYTGKLSNEGETISLYLPSEMYVDDTENVYPYVLVEKVTYDNKLPWPNVAENGKLLQRIENTYANDYASWYAISKAVKITTSILPNAVENVDYSECINITGGQSPFTLELVSGNLPKGLSLNSETGNITGIPAENGSFSITMEVTDYINETYEKTITLNVNPNTLPITNDDVAETQSGISVSIYVLGNDTDNDGDKSYWTINTNQPDNGNVFINSDKSITYTPNSDFIGTEEFTYSISDASGTSEAKITVDVNDYSSVFAVKIDRGEDDAEEFIATELVDIVSSDLEFIRDDKSNGGEQLIGLKFRDIAIPKGANITNAYIQFKVDETSTEVTNITIHGENSASPLDFNETNKINSRSLTTASVSWTPPEWNIEGLQGDNQKTPDISSVIREIVNLDAWTSENSLVVIISGSGQRIAESFDGDAAGAAVLYINYKISSEIKPIANAGNDRQVNLGDRITLDAGNSSDANNGSLNYSWELISKPTNSIVELSNKYIVSPAFTPDIQGTYKINLIVNNGQLNSIADEIIINVTNGAPFANAGIDQFVKFNSLVILDGSSSYDPEGKEISYLWTLVSKPENSIATLSADNIASPAFVGDTTGEYVLNLVVNDGSMSSAISNIKVTVFDNLPPVANAGSNQIARQGITVTLDGKGSNDPDRNAITYQWILTSKPDGSNAELSDNSLVNPSFVTDKTGEYLFGLTVNDGKTSSSQDIVKITVNNIEPIANAGADKEVTLGTTVTLDASNSLDPEGGMIDYLWTITSKPAGSHIELNDITAQKPEFISDVAGEYEISLFVNDGYFTSQADIVYVNVTSDISIVHLTENTIKDVNVYPNPSNSNANIELLLNTTAELNISLYDINGQLVKSLYNGKLVNGNHNFNIDFNAEGLQGGIYYIKIQQQNAIITKKIVYLSN